MLTGWPPFYTRDKRQLVHSVLKAPLDFPSFMSRDARSIITALMNRQPNARLGATNTLDIQSHSFYGSLDFEALLRREIPVPAAKATPFRNTAAQHPQNKVDELPVHGPFQSHVDRVSRCNRRG